MCASVSIQCILGVEFIHC